MKSPTATHKTRYAFVCATSLMTDSGSCCRSATWVVIASEYVRHRHMTTAGRTVTHRFVAILLTLLARTEECRKKPQSESINEQWHNSPLWAKAFLRSFCHPSLFLAALLQCLSPKFLASPVTPSSHLSLGLPFCLLPSTTAAKTLLAGFWSSSRMTCPAHLRRLILIVLRSTGP